MEFVLITGRTTGQGKGLESGKTSVEYREEAAVAYMNEEDMRELGIEENAPLRVSTSEGSVVVRGKKGDLDRGKIFIPMGPWASALTGSDTEGTGMPKAKGIEARISKTEEKLTSFEDLLERMRGA